MDTMTEWQRFRDKDGHLRRLLWVVCPKCKVRRWIREDSAKRKVFTRLCKVCNARNMGGKKGSDNPNWRGGRYKNGDGYIMVLLTDNDFFRPMATERSYVQEHRLIMAKHLGRCLLSWEVVHHKNGIRDDNRLENLQLLPGRSYHLVDTTIKTLIKTLERTVRLQTKTIEGLKERIRELEGRTIIKTPNKEG